MVAVELEFYLVDKKRDDEGFIQPPCAPGSDERNMQSQVYSVDNLDHFADVLRDIDDLARQQGIPANGALAEASPVQFEINRLKSTLYPRRAAGLRPCGAAETTGMLKNA